MRTEQNDLLMLMIAVLLLKGLQSAGRWEDEKSMAGIECSLFFPRPLLLLNRYRAFELRQAGVDV
eukprot:921013-Pelagomonas_calceolata.AAC.2